MGGLTSGSKSLKLGNQTQPGEDTTDVIGVIEAVIAAEDAACKHYRKIIQATEGDDYVTQDMCITLLGDEEEHLVLFKGFLKEYKKRSDSTRKVAHWQGLTVAQATFVKPLQDQHSRHGPKIGGRRKCQQT